VAKVRVSALAKELGTDSKTLIAHLQSIGEYVKTASSIAHMKAPANWTEPFQAPSFDEYTLVLAGAVLVDHDGGQLRVEAGQSVLTRAGERIRYSTGSEGADYVAVCLPAFSPETVNREEDGE
jgi:mannose-6-phosphate isomerase-like protein (cupin superfamily)